MQELIGGTEGSEDVLQLQQLGEQGLRGEDEGCQDSQILSMDQPEEAFSRQICLFYKLIYTHHSFNR